MKEIIVIIMTVILVDNFVLSQFLGICPFLGVSKKMDSATGMGIAVTFVMVLDTAATWPVQKFLLDAYGIGYLQTVVFILIIAALVQLVEMTCLLYTSYDFFRLPVSAEADSDSISESSGSCAGLQTSCGSSSQSG